MPASPASPARRRGTAALERAVAIVAVGSVLVLSGCTTFGPVSGNAGTATPEPHEATVESDAPEPAEHERTADEDAGPGVAVLDPRKHERGIGRRKQALAAELDEPSPAAGTGYYMDVQEAQLRQALNGSGIGLFRENPSMRLRISGTEAFETGSARLTAAIQQPLARVAEVLEEYRLTLVVVHGHTDAAGDADHNQRLSEQRALAVARLLVESGLEAERVLTVGHGESRPLQHETSPGDRWPDRRIEIQLDLISG